MPDKVNLAEKLSLFADLWAPRAVARLNDYEVKVVKVRGDFVWHAHGETDELFMVLKGSLRIDLRDGAVELGPGELYVVPRGVEHKPFAAEECEMLLVEPRGVVNTGNAGGALTASQQSI